MIHPGMLPKKTAAPHFGVSILGKLGYDETKWAPIPAQGRKAFLWISNSCIIYGGGTGGQLLQGSRESGGVAAHAVRHGQKTGGGAGCSALLRLQPGAAPDRRGSAPVDQGQADPGPVSGDAGRYEDHQQKQLRQIHPGPLSAVRRLLFRRLDPQFLHGVSQY